MNGVKFGSDHMSVVKEIFPTEFCEDLSTFDILDDVIIPAFLLANFQDVLAVSDRYDDEL